MQSRIKEYVEKNSRHGRILTMENEPEKSFVIRSRKFSILRSLIGLLAVGLLVVGIYILWLSFSNNITI